jgi:hypothetical protein
MEIVADGGRDEGRGEEGRGRGGIFVSSVVDV